MSDSDSDCLSPRNLFNFENDGSIISKAVVKGPNFQSSVNLNFTNTSNMPRNFEKRLYDDGFSQRSERSRFDRRDMSPASMRSMPGFQPRGFHQSFYPGGMAHSSIMRSRAVSPSASMRSMSSNISVAADYILSTLHNMQFNKYELRNIKETCNKLMRGRIHKKHRQKRKHRPRRSCDSGDQGSDSSISSSDDCRSTKTSASMHKGYNRYQDYRYYQYRRPSDDSRSVKSTRTDFTDIRRTIRESEMYRDCTDNFKQNSFKNMFGLGPRHLNSSSMSRNTTVNMSRSRVMGPPRRPIASQRDRFKNSFLLPSQRFNSSSVVASIPEENPDRRYQKAMPNFMQKKASPVHGDFRGFQVHATEEESDTEEIFNEVTILEKTIKKTEDEIREKRNLEVSMSTKTRFKRNLNESSSPVSKKSKVATPKETKQTPKKTPKHMKKQEKLTPKNVKQQTPVKEPANKKPEDFVFAKPQLPLKTAESKILNKPIKNQKNAEPTQKNTVKNIEQKEITAKSKEPSVEEIIEKEKQLLAKEIEQKAKENKKVVEDHSETTLQSTSDVSLRPSFMKRKLFTQTLDVTETKNISNESLSSSPQSIYESKEKNRTRKLVTNSHYLSRDVQEDGNNFLDLIHKIVPPDQINLTQNNRSSDPVFGSKIDKSRGNLTSKSAVNLRNKTDSFTDEDIFVVRDQKKGVTEKVLSKCTVTLDKLETVKLISQQASEKTSVLGGVRMLPETASKNVEKVIAPVSSNIVKGKTPRKTEQTKKKVLSNAAHAFWNCDSESDAGETPQKKPVAKRNLDSTKKRSDSPTVKNVVKSIKTFDTTKASKVTKPNLNETKKATPKAVAKTLKSVLKGNSSTISLEELGDKLNNSRSLRVRAVKELKEKKVQSSKTLKPDLEETLYDVIKKRRAKANSFSSTLESSKENSKNVTVLNKTTKATKPLKQETKKVAEKPVNKVPETKVKMATKKLNKDSEKDNLQSSNKIKTKMTKETLMTLDISPIKATSTDRSSKLNSSNDNVKRKLSPNVTAKNISKKNIANETVTKDLNQSMITRRLAMKQNLSRKSTSMHQMPPPKLKVTKKIDKKTQDENKVQPNTIKNTTKADKVMQNKVPENKAPLTNKNNNVMNQTAKSKMFKTIVDGAVTESDTSLNTTKRGRGRPRKDTTIVNIAKPKVKSNIENEIPDKSFRMRKNTTICACCEDDDDGYNKNNRNCTKKPAENQKNATQTKFTQPRNKRNISPISKSFINTTVNKSTISGRRKNMVDDSEWGRGLSHATIGVVPRHCAQQLCNNARAAADDTQSLTVRSAASTSVLTRSRRTKFLHVF